MCVGIWYGESMSVSVSVSASANVSVLRKCKSVRERVLALTERVRERVECARLAWLGWLVGLNWIRPNWIGRLARLARLADLIPVV